MEHDENGKQQAAPTHSHRTPGRFYIFPGVVADRARSFRDEAPTTAAAAATVILEGVRAGRWRILVGDDAHRIDERVRQTPERAYDLEFYQSLAAEAGRRQS